MLVQITENDFPPVFRFKFDHTGPFNSQLADFTRLQLNLPNPTIREDSPVLSVNPPTVYKKIAAHWAALQRLYEQHRIFTGLFTI